MSTCFDMSLNDIDSSQVSILKKTMDISVNSTTFSPLTRWKRLVCKLLRDTNTVSESVDSN